MFIRGEVHCQCQIEEMPLQNQIETYKKINHHGHILVETEKGKTEADSDYINVN